MLSPPGDDRVRCPWAASPGPMRDYHDVEWGIPVRGESGVFERLTLEAFQSGLSWSTILAKRPAFREVFADFDAEVIATYDDSDVLRLMQDSRIVRNRKKIEAALINSRAVIDLREDAGLEAFVWSFRPDATPAPVVPSEVPTVGPESIALSKALKKRGFAFVGPTTMHALMEALGIIDTHLVGCYRRGASGVWT